MRRALALLALLPLLALFLLPATLSQETAIRPRGIVLAATALLFAAVTAAGGRRPRPWIDLPLAALLGLAASHLLFSPGLPRGHDTLSHVWGIWAAGRAAAEGSPAALWLHHIGMGTPFLQFYGPLPFYATLPFFLAGLSAAATLKAGLLAFGALAAVLMHAAVTRWTGDRRAGLVAAAAYAFAPYRLLDAHFRAAFGETAALALLPLLFLLAAPAVREGGRRRIAAAAVAAALLILTHPISALMAALGLGIGTLADILADRRSAFRIASRLAAVWVLGIALAGFFVVPFVEGIERLELDRVARGDAPLRVGPDPGDLIVRKAGRRMSYYFGLTLLALLPLGFGWGRLPGEETPREGTLRPLRPLRGLPWVTLAALVLSLGPVCRWLAAAFPPLAAIQFPWRFLGLASCGAAVAAGLAAARLLKAAGRRPWAVLVPGVLAALLILDASLFTGAADWYPRYEGLGYLRRSEPDCGRRWGCWEQVPVEPPYPLRISGLFLPPSRDTGPYGDVSYFCCAYPEFQPRRLYSFTPAEAGVGLVAGDQGLRRLGAKPYATWQRQRGRPQPRSFRRAGGEIVVELDGRPGEVVVLESHLPGWRVLEADGWREVEPTPAGLLRASAAEGQREVRFRYGWTPARVAGWLLTALSALLTLFWLAPMTWAGRWARRRADPPPGRG